MTKTRHSQKNQALSPVRGANKSKQRIHWYATLAHPDNKPTLTTLVYQSHQKTSNTLAIIALDTSGSTLASEQLSDAKAVVLSLCEHFHQKRQRMSLLGFGNQQIHWLLDNRAVPSNLKERLNTLKAGGGTPLRQALLDLAAYLKKRKQIQPSETQRLFLITDGRSRQPISDISFDKTIDITLLDSEKATVRLNKATEVAQQLNAHYYRLFDTH